MTSPSTDLPGGFVERLRGMRLPLIAAPMFGVSDLRIVDAACAAGIAGAFPTANCGSADELEHWLGELGRAPDTGWHRGPVCPNVIVHRSFRRLDRDLAVLAANPPEVIITSVGNPRPVIDAMAGSRTVILTDVATIHHAERAIADGAHGLVLLTAGAGGQTGWLNPIAFCRAVRRFFDGPIALAGSIADGVGIRAALTMGADLAYSGTRFIATAESSAPEAYKAMILASTSDDVITTKAITGLRVNVLRGWVDMVGLDIEQTPASIELRLYEDMAGGYPSPAYSAGHATGLVDDIPTVAEVVERLRGEFAQPSERLDQWQAISS